MLDHLTHEGFKKRLEVMKRNASQLCGVATDGTALGPKTVKFFEDLLKDVDDPEVRKQREIFVNAMASDPKTKQQFCAIRIEQFQNYVFADQNIINTFFEVVNLKDEQRPVYQNNTLNEVTVKYVGQDGGRVQKTIVKPQTEGFVDMRLLTTPEVDYKLKDIYTGSVAESALATINLAYDMANQREALAFTLLTSALGTFTVTGARQDRVYVANSRIQTANLPTTNIITLTGNSGSTKFRMQALKEIKKYGDSWGKAFLDGPVVPTGRILIPAVDAADIADEIVPSGTTANPVANQLLTDGYSTLDYLGMRWTLIVDNTLAKKSCYAEFGRKVGRIYLKPGMDLEQSDDTSYKAIKDNRGRRFMQSAIGLFVPQTTRVNFVKVVYTT